jgi:deoxycytidylate deaminase
MAKPEFDDIYMELAVNIAKRSHCIKAQVGAVLARDTRIISIGYNGHHRVHIIVMKNFQNMDAHATRKEAVRWHSMPNKMPFFLLPKMVLK